MATYKTLSSNTLDTQVNYATPVHALPESVTLDSPAIDVMTDFSRVSAVYIAPSRTIEQAEQRMISSGIRLLFVANEYHQVIGIITSRDLEGDRVMRRTNETGVSRKELTVRDIMTPQHQIDVLEMGDVATSRVGDLVETLKSMGRQHALVVDRDAAGKQVIRGMLSTTQIGKQLGQSIPTAEKAGSFADLAAMS
jgi:CBS domain containing-hemolysin-like protein